MKKIKIKILLVEDDTNLGFLLLEFLETNGFDVKLYRDGETGYSGFKNGFFDFCILDVMLPNLNGFDLAKRIRAENKKIPIIFLTAKSHKSDVVKGFNTGVDDYITKPFDEDELLCRINAIFTRAGHETDDCNLNVFNIGSYHFDYPNHLLVYKGNSKRLTTKESEVLRFLCMSKGKICKRDDLLISIWGTNDYFTGRSLDVFITKIRKYLGKDQKIKIESIPRTGYILSDF